MTMLATEKLHRPPETLVNGDTMSQAEFHVAYQKMPENVKAELIEGVVYMASPLRLGHGINHIPLGSLLFAYESNTPGTQSGDNATVILGKDAEPQPDLFLRILPEYGGRSGTTDDYITGPPELVVEIALSSRAIDLHAKQRDYRKYGVTEYLVACIEDQELRWFDFRANMELTADNDGILRIKGFPGLWIDSKAVFARDFNQLMKVLNQGLAVPEHAAFVEKLNGQFRVLQPTSTQVL
jgi:Uma2 family endonuclease